ncbi:hypothetical protein [Streptomyces sp. NPDC093111]|uniref:hypothetical protein n=1 Tax=Streptomyces sp. NPDC093111 TaxID=3154978 RepID=UPI00342FA9FC
MKRIWITAAAAAAALGVSGAAYYGYNASGEVTVFSLCAPQASTPEYVAAYAPTVVIATVTDRTRYIPDASDPPTGVAVATLRVEKTLKGTAPTDLTVAQSFAKAPDGTYTTHEPLYQSLDPARRYAVAVLDRTEHDGRWVWGADAADSAAADDRWAAAVAARAIIPESTFDDTQTTTP